MGGREADEAVDVRRWMVPGLAVGTGPKTFVTVVTVRTVVSHAREANGAKR